MDYFLCVLGMVFIVEGLPYFAFPNKVKAWLARLAQIPEGTLRVMGTLAVAAGLALIYFGRT